MEPQSHEHLSEERLQALLDGELPTGEHGAVEAHLAGCARCAEELETWRVLFSDLSTLPTHAPGRGFGDRVLAVIRPPGRYSLAARARRRLAALGLPPKAGHVPGERLQDLLDGALGARQVARIRAHVDACAPCAGELEAWRAVYARLSGLEGFAPAPGFAERVIARLRSAPAVARVPAWRRALATAQRFVPRTRRAWAAISGVALTPAVTAALVIYNVFSHPTLTPQALASFVVWQLRDLFAAGWGALSAMALDAGQLFGAEFLVSALVDAPWVVAGGALAYSVLSVLALRVLYNNLSGGHRHARVSLR